VEAIERFLISRRQLFGGLTSAGSSILLPGCGGGGSSPSSELVSGAWPQANALFLNDPRWIGGDGAYSVDLGSGRVLWLFGDSFIADTAARSRSNAILVRNSVAIQTGYDPTTASIKYYWNSASSPANSFFHAPSSSTWLWPNGGVLVGGRLILFLNENKAVSGGLGFQGVGWTAIAVENPTADPSQWTLTTLATKLEFGLELGSASILANGYLYAYSAGLSNPGPTYAARWPVSNLSGNSLLGPQWYAGSGGWLTAAQIVGNPTPVVRVDQAIFSIDPSTKQAPYVVIQTSGFGGATLAYQTAPSLIGPFSGARTFYTPPDSSRANALIYGALMHAEQSAPGYDFVATYNVNNTNFTTLVNDMSIYYPKFVRAKWA
jgi:hypothetical protein